MVEEVKRCRLSIWIPTFIKLMYREFRFKTLTTNELPVGKHARYGVLVLRITTVGIVGQIYSSFAFIYSVLCNQNPILVKSGYKYFLRWKVFMFHNSQRTQSASVTTAKFLILFKEIFSAYSENQTKQINTLCGQNTEFLNVTAGGKYSYCWALESLMR
jgi:hypothetical protein